MAPGGQEAKSCDLAQARPRCIFLLVGGGPFWSFTWFSTVRGKNKRPRAKFHIISIFMRNFTIPILRNFRNFWKYCVRNFIFRGKHMIEYLSEWDERWVVGEVKTCIFLRNFNYFGRILITSFLSTFSVPAKFLDFGEISEKFENVASETLFSEANIWSNICRWNRRRTQKSRPWPLDYGS